jgi:membrane-bound ClpP family serine protease
MEIMDFLTTLALWQAGILTMGLLLVIVEMFHPGFGAPGITGLLLLMIGVVFTARNLLEASVLILIILLVLGVALALVLRSATKGRLSKKLILSESLKRESGYVSSEELENYLGKEGIALSVLRPAGVAAFEGFKLDVVSQGDFISKGAKVKIIKIEGRRVVVSEI